MLLSSGTVWSPINQNGDVPINTGTVMIVLLPSVFCKHTGLLKPRNYKDQTDSKLTESGFCAHIILKTCVLQGRHGKGMQLLGSLHWGNNKTSISSPAGWFWISETHTFWQFHKLVQISRALIRNGWQLRVTGKNIPYRQKHTSYSVCTNFQFYPYLGKTGPLIYACMNAFWSTGNMLQYICIPPF